MPQFVSVGRERQRHPADGTYRLTPPGGPGISPTPELIWSTWNLTRLPTRRGTRAGGAPRQFAAIPPVGVSGVQSTNARPSGRGSTSLTVRSTGLPIRRSRRPTHSAATRRWLVIGSWRRWTTSAGERRDAHLYRPGSRQFSRRRQLPTLRFLVRQPALVRFSQVHSSMPTATGCPAVISTISSIGSSATSTVTSVNGLDLTALPVGVRHRLGRHHYNAALDFNGMA